MTGYHKSWIGQCDAVERIRERFGSEKAIGYLIGEKLVDFVRLADTRPEFASELPAFVAEVRRIFAPEEIDAYLSRIRRVGPLAHIMTEEKIAEMREKGVLDEEDPVEVAQDILIVERIKELLLS